MSKKNAIIIGAGIGGIATANLLAKAGYNVSVYEKNTSPGGRAGLLEKDGFRFDTGPSWYLMPEVFEHYFNLLGSKTEDYFETVKLHPAYKVFFEHAEPITIATNPKKDRATFESIEPGAGKALESYVERSVHIYDMAVKHFLYTNFTSIRDFLALDVLRYGPRMLRLALQPIDTYISTFFKDKRLKQVLEYTMVFLGASPYDAPAIYSLMGALDFKYGVFYPKRGIYDIISQLVNIGSKMGVNYHYNSPVASIYGDSGIARGIELEDGSRIDADVVISNADLHFTETRLLRAEHRTYPESYWRTRDAGPSAMLLYLGIKGKLPQLEHHSLCFVDAWKENFDAIYHTKTIPKSASIYLSRASATDPNVAPEGHEALVVLVPLPSGVSLSDNEQSSLANTYISQIGKMAGIKNLRSRIVSQTIVGPDDFSRNFNAWESTALGPSHTLRQSAFFRTHNRSKKLSNLFYVGGSTIPGIGLPMCLIGAELVYKHLAKHRRGGQVEKIVPIGDSKGL